MIFSIYILENIVIISEENEACADIGLFHLNNKEECQNAFYKETGLFDPIGHVNMDNRPPGCFFHSMKNWYWNDDGNGVAISCDCKSVCRHPLAKEGISNFMSQYQAMGEG